MQDTYKLTIDEIYATLNTNPKGLDSSQVEQGQNILKQAKKKHVLLVFLSHFISLMAWLLWAGGVISLIVGHMPLAIAMWMVNIINGIFSFYQEYKAGKATDALTKMLPSYARVVRNGVEEKILAEDLCVGDIIILEEGDKISADARIIDCNYLTVNQSILTGESNPVRRTSGAIVNDKSYSNSFELANLIFAGTSVSSGTCRAVVTAIGMQTEFGKIAELTQDVEEVRSPLERELDRLVKRISIIACCAGVVIFALNIFYVGNPIARAFLFALSVMISFIPEGLLPTVTLSLAMGVQRMAHKHALVKKLSVVESLGSASVICSDKTGTLTQNQMTVTNLWLPRYDSVEVSGRGYAPVGKIDCEKSADLDALIKAAALCSNARVVAPNDENPDYTVLGDPTEACLTVLAEKAGFYLDELRQEELRLRELPFDSSRKRMTTIHQHKGGRISYTKGAPKEVQELCTHILIDGAVREITDSDRERIMKANDNYATQGLRVLAVSYRELDGKDRLSTYTNEIVEKDMVFIGLTVMEDPPREEVKLAVEECHRAGIKIIMITGDYGLTAISIAKRIGIVTSNAPRLITGLELGNMTDDELEKALSGEVVFARVAPEQKYKIVYALQEMGHIVAMTGDGVNDAPALKKADIGIAMGITGTDVAKDAADMILTDDNFSSIVSAVKEGRVVYTNIRKFLTYIFTSNMSTAIPDFTFLLSRGLVPLPLTIMQNLGVDLGTDIVPALGLGVEQAGDDIMDKPPRRMSEGLLNAKMILKAFLWYGLMAGLLAIGGYFLANYLNGWPKNPLGAEGSLTYAKATTMTFGVIIFAQIGNVLNCRTERQSIFKIGLFTNKHVLVGIITEILLLLGFAYVPFIQKIFDTATISLVEWGYLLFIPLPIILFEEIRKWFLRRRDEKIIRRSV